MKGTIEKRGENSWRIGFRKSSAAGREWVRRTLTFPASMSEVQQRAAAEVELARLQVETADAAARQEQERVQLPPAVQALVDRYHMSDADALQLLAAMGTAGRDCLPITVWELYDRWMMQHCIPELQPTTVKTYQALMLGRVLPAIGKRLVSSLTAMELQELMTQIRSSGRRTTALPPDQRKRKRDRDKAMAPEKPLSSRTVQHIYDTMSDMFDQGVTWKLIPANPLADVSRPKARKSSMTCLDDEQAVALLRCLAKEQDLSFRCAVMLALLCGLRLNEVDALAWADVDFVRSQVSVHAGLNYTPETGHYINGTKTEAGMRVMQLPAGMMDLLRETLAWQDETHAILGDRWRGEGQIICGWDGHRLHHDTPSKQFRKFADRHGFPGVRFHDLRHSHATLLFANNLDAVAVAHRLGHSSPDTTFRVYAHAIRSRDVASATAMQSYIDTALEVDGQNPATSSDDSGQ